jgi:hypothetical protein
MKTNQFTDTKPDIKLPSVAHRMLRPQQQFEREEI